MRSRSHGSIPPPNQRPASRIEPDRVGSITPRRRGPREVPARRARRVRAASRARAGSIPRRRSGRGKGRAPSRIVPPQSRKGRCYGAIRRPGRYPRARAKPAATRKGGAGSGKRSAAHNRAKARDTKPFLATARPELPWVFGPLSTITARRSVPGREQSRPRFLRGSLPGSWRRPIAVRRRSAGRRRRNRSEPT